MQPVIIDSKLQFNGVLATGNKPDQIVLHNADAIKCTIHDVHSWHLSNGWSGCGYHYFVRKDGTIYRGRPENAIGAHCPPSNSHSIGICAEGDYMKETDMPLKQMISIINLCIWIESRYHIVRVVGHKEVPYSTDCPGIYFPLNKIRNGIKAGISQPILPSKPVSTKGNPVVLHVQDALNALGFVGENGRCLTEDGVNGENTIFAVRKFQSVMHLKVDGVAGDNTQDCIHNILGRPTLSEGCAHVDAVRYVQSRLKGLSTDGCFGTSTKSAVREWQRGHGLYSDGVVGSKTWDTLIR
jgi:N-acetylmuramoyl-L-alanine amidase